MKTNPRNTEIEHFQRIIRTIAWQATTLARNHSKNRSQSVLRESSSKACRPCILYLYCICYDGVVSAAQCTATFKDLLSSPESIYRKTGLKCLKCAKGGHLKNVLILIWGNSWLPEFDFWILEWYRLNYLVQTAISCPVSSFVWSTY